MLLDKCKTYFLKLFKILTQIIAKINIFHKTLTVEICYYSNKFKYI